MIEKDIYCLYCEKNSDQVPLINIHYKGMDMRICPQHLPILIHEPDKLAGKLPNADKLYPANHNDDC